MTMMQLLRTSTGVAVALPGAQTLPLTMILGIGRNYAEHAKEQGASAPDASTGPMVFTKNAASACLSGDEIVVPKVCQDPARGGDQTDYEGELAIILGHGPTACKDIDKRNAMDFVLGYCCANDVSARWWQKTGSGGQFFRGKSFDTFCPLGPGVTPRAQVPDPANLRVVTRINGETRQDGSTAEMIFDVATLVSELSRGTTLLPGTVILTGTPSGVGMARKPPQYLQNGDMVEIEITGLGTLKNCVRWA